jgi:hypothetical protein
MDQCASCQQLCDRPMFCSDPPGTLDTSVTLRLLYAVSIIFSIIHGMARHFHNYKENGVPFKHMSWSECVKLVLTPEKLIGDKEYKSTLVRCGPLNLRLSLVISKALKVVSCAMISVHFHFSSRGFTALTSDSEPSGSYIVEVWSKWHILSLTMVMSLVTSDNISPLFPLASTALASLGQPSCGPPSCINLTSFVVVLPIIVTAGIFFLTVLYLSMRFVVCANQANHPKARMFYAFFNFVTAFLMFMSSLVTSELSLITYVLSISLNLVANVEKPLRMITW